MKQILLILAILSFPGQAAAAEIFFGTNALEFSVGQRFEVGVLLNTQEQEVNTVGGTILFPADALSLQAVYEGGSAVSFWIQPPALREEGEIAFSGVLPGGIAESRALLFSLVFQAEQTGELTLQAAEELILLNDGQGTLAEIGKAPATIRISESASEQEFAPLLDSGAPEPFVPQVSRDPDIFEGRWFLAFATRDQASGIAGYAVQETRSGEPKEEAWVAAQSPYLLEDQSLRSHIFVKALDKAGNERVAVVFPQNPPGWYENPLLWGIIGVIILMLFGALYLATRRRKSAKNILLACFFAASFLAFALAGTPVQAATISVGPSSGTFTVGSTFEVSLFLDTEGRAVNALGIFLEFPADKLQVVSPSAGQSIVSVWTAAPTFNNQTGRISLQGGIPGGITTSSGLVTTLTFRVKSVGTAVVRFLDESQVLLHDGVGTNDLQQTSNGVYELVLPPPAGPIVVSETHPEQSRWYANPNISLTWVNPEQVDGYSYLLNKEPVDIPDDIVDGQRASVSYTNLADGVYYFHVKAFRRQAWGGVSHFAVKIDTTPPAEFPVSVEPSSRTTVKNPTVRFATTDTLSGLRSYELKVVPLSTPTAESGAEQLFYEERSPAVLELPQLGSYDVIVRAYDQAGNFKEAVKRVSLVSIPFQIIQGEGLQITSNFLIPWNLFLLLSLAVLAGLAYGAVRIRKWRFELTSRRTEKKLPSRVQEQLEELKKYRAKYGSKISVILLLVLGSALFAAQPASAQSLELAPPLTTTISRNISNQEIFYVGGKTDTSLSEVIIYLQNLRTGETFSYNVTADRQGSWFYRHDSFLSSGSYLLWTQSQVADQMSPPSPQIQLNVTATAIQFGASRISYEMLYLVFTVLLFLVVVGMGGYIAFHWYHGRREDRELAQEIREAEESVKRGFAVLRRDILAQFEAEKERRGRKQASEEERMQEERLLKDLEWVERYIGREVWDIKEEAED